METYGKILLIAMPAFLLLVLFEKWYGWRKGKDTVRNMDMISSLASGVTNVTKDVIGLYFVVLSYPFFLKNLAITTVPNQIITYIIACLLYTSDAADERSSVDLGGRRIIQKNKPVYQGCRTIT